MTIPAFYQAANDPTIRRRALRVYLLLTQELDVLEYRPVKNEYVARKLDLHRPDVTDALTELCEAGYLQALMKKKVRVGYRLVFSRPPAEQERAS